MHSQRILIRGLNWLGDSVMSLPALQRIREAYPEAHIAILTLPKMADLWRPPLIDEVITIAPDAGFWGAANAMRRGRFDTCVVLPMSFRSTLEPLLAGIPNRIGCVHRGRAFLLSKPVSQHIERTEIYKLTKAEVLRLTAEGKEQAPKPIDCHHLFRYLELAAAMGAGREPVEPRLPLSDQEVQQALCRFELAPTSDSSPLFGMCPGGEYGATKRWPLERFAEAAAAIHAETGCRWLLAGGPGDSAACGQIADALNSQFGARTAVDYSGRTTLRELAALLKSCGLVLCNDSGPMHLAAAVGTRVAAVFSSTSVEYTGPGLPGDGRHLLIKSSAPCSPCFLRECPIDMRCMNSLDARRVVSGVLRLLERNPQTQGGTGRAAPSSVSA